MFEHNFLCRSVLNTNLNLFLYGQANFVQTYKLHVTMQRVRQRFK